MFSFSVSFRLFRLLLHRHHLTSMPPMLLQLGQVGLHEACLAVNGVRLPNLGLLTAANRTSLLRSRKFFEGDGRVGSNVGSIHEAPKALPMACGSCIRRNVFPSEPSRGDLLNQLLLLQVEVRYLIELSRELEVSLPSLLDAFILGDHGGLRRIDKVGRSAPGGVVILESRVATTGISTNISGVGEWRSRSSEDGALLL